MKKLWSKIKSWVQNNAAAVGGAIGGALGGPFGALIGAALAELVLHKSIIDVPTYLEPQFDAWSESVMEPLLKQIILDVSSTNSPTQLISESFINKLNVHLKNLTALQAYYEFMESIEAVQSEKQLYHYKAVTVAKSIEIVRDAYEMATSENSQSYNQLSVSFNASAIGKVGNENLIWPANVTASYLSYKSNTTTNDGGVIIQIPPPTGGTIKPGGTTTTKPGSGGTLVTSKPITGGTTTTPGGSNDGGTTTNPTTTQPVTTPVEIVAENKNDNKKYLILGGALVLAAFIFKGK